MKSIVSKALRSLRRRNRMLCLVAHYFGDDSMFRGKSTSFDNEKRAGHVKKAITQMEAMPGVDVCVCGLAGNALVDLGRDFSPLSDPRFLVYEVLGALFDYIDEYDYFMVIEDDIWVPRQTIDNIVAFDKTHGTNLCFHPNRIEIIEGRPMCVDLKACPGWSDTEMQYQGHRLRVANNPHSAFLMLSRKKLLYLQEFVDKTFRDRFFGGHMASAFVYYHRPFKLFRNYDDLKFHTVTHLDHWMG